MNAAGSLQKVGFSPVALVAYCEDEKKQDGFDADKDFPYVSIDYTGTVYTCPKAEGCTKTAGAAKWYTGVDCIKVKDGKSGRYPTHFEAEACEQAPIIGGWAASGPKDQCPAFEIGAYTVKEEMSVGGRTITPFDIEGLMFARYVLFMVQLPCAWY